MGFALSVKEREKMSSSSMKQEYFKNILTHIQDGIIVMNNERTILSMNPAANNLTGWKINENVPYCTYCQSRVLSEGEDRCLLISKNEVPYFLSEMPTYQGQHINVEMSTAQLMVNDETGESQYLLVLKDQTLKRREEEAKFSKLMIKRLTEAQESEHKRLAQELHDGVSQSLYSISLAMDNIQVYTQQPVLQEYLDEVRIELDKVISDVKSYSYQLRPKSLDQLGLSATIDALAKSLMTKKAGLVIELDSNLVNRLPVAIEINLYRVMQEALHNMMKYAEATFVTIHIFYDEKKDQILIEYKDNGIGFDTEKEKNGLGLRHMKERVDQLGGHFLLSSSIGQGTSITIECTVNEEVEY